MANGVLIETDIQAKNIDALNRSATCTADVAGGMPVTLGAMNGDVFTATKANATSNGIWVAYNPSEFLTKVGDEYYAGLSADPRDYTNLANRVFDVFKLKVGDLIEITKDNLSDTTVGADPVGKYFAIDADGNWDYTTSAPTTYSGLVIRKVKNLPFPNKKAIGMDNVASYVCECVVE